MAKQHLTFIFDDPNRDDVFVRAFRQILLDRLAARWQENMQQSNNGRNL